MNLRASASTRSAGGLSATKWRASFVAMWRAVAGSACEIVQRRASLVDAVFGVGLSEKLAWARLMPIGLEQNRARLARFAIGTRDAPAGQDARELGDIGLRVAGSDAQRMHFDNFAVTFSFRPRPATFPGAASGPIEFWLSR